MEDTPQDLSGNIEELESMDEFYERMIEDLNKHEERFPNLISVWRTHITSRRNKYLSELHRCKLLVDSMNNGTMNDLSLSQITRLVCLMQIINTGNNT